MNDIYHRLLVIFILTVLFAGMILHFSGAAPQNETVRQSYEKLQQPEKHIGETVYFWSGVSEVSQKKIVFENFTVVNVNKTVNAGDGAQIYGSIQTKNTVAAENVIVIKSENRTRLYIISAVGVLIGISVFLNSWMVDPRTLTFVPREGDGDA